MSTPHEITDKEPAGVPTLEDVWGKIHDLYEEDPGHAVRSQELIKTLHHYIAIDIYSHLTPGAKRRGVRVVEEAPILGSYKKKDVDIAVVDPYSGPLMLIGVRSQMSSIGKNVLTYYQDIIGECISLQERFPMTTMGYIYLHPLSYTQNGKKTNTDVARYARLYASIGGRDDGLYKHEVGSYDHFAYAVVNFDEDYPELCDDLIRDACPDTDLSIMTFTSRMIETFKKRNVWIDDVFD